MKTTFKDWYCTIIGAYYGQDHSRKAIILYEYDDQEDTTFYAEPVAIATVNLHDRQIPPECVFIKDYSENQGIKESLIEAGVITPEAESKTFSGFVEIFMHRLTDKALVELFDYRSITGKILPPETEET